MLKSLSLGCCKLSPLERPASNRTTELGGWIRDPEPSWNSLITITIVLIIIITIVIIHGELTVCQQLKKLSVSYLSNTMVLGNGRFLSQFSRCGTKAGPQLLRQYVGG